MVTIYGAKHVLIDEPIGAKHVRNTTRLVLPRSQTEVSTGVRIAPTEVLTGVTIATSTMPMVAIGVMMMALVVSSMTIPIDLMLSSIVPTRTSVYTLG
jgi:hypothetical protein